jgi:hypothetical protein
MLVLISESTITRGLFEALVHGFCGHYKRMRVTWLNNKAACVKRFDIYILSRFRDQFDNETLIAMICNFS